MHAEQGYDRDEKIWWVALVDDNDHAVEIEGQFAFYGNRALVSTVRSRINTMLRNGKTIDVWPCYKNWSL